MRDACCPSKLARAFIESFAMRRTNQFQPTVSANFNDAVNPKNFVVTNDAGRFVKPGFVANGKFGFYDLNQLVANDGFAGDTVKSFCPNLWRIRPRFNPLTKRIGRCGQRLNFNFVVEVANFHRMRFKVLTMDSNANGMT